MNQITAEIPQVETFYIEQPNRIMVLLDGSKRAERALAHAAEVAHERDAEIVILHTYQSPAYRYRAEMNIAGHVTYFDEVTAQAKRYVDAEVNKLRAQHLNVHGYQIETAVSRDVVSDFIQAVEAQTVVIAEAPRSLFERILFDGLATQLANMVNVDVIKVH